MIRASLRASEFLLNSRSHSAGPRSSKASVRLSQGTPHPRPAARTTLQPALRRLSILLVEDNAVNRKLGVRMLEKMGHTVTLALNGQVAVEPCERNDST